MAAPRSREGWRDLQRTPRTCEETSVVRPRRVQNVKTDIRNTNTNASTSTNTKTSTKKRVMRQLCPSKFLTGRPLGTVPCRATSTLLHRHPSLSVGLVSPSARSLGGMSASLALSARPSSAKRSPQQTFSIYSPPLPLSELPLSPVPNKNTTTTISLSPGRTKSPVQTISKMSGAPFIPPLRLSTSPSPVSQTLDLRSQHTALSGAPNMSIVITGSYGKIAVVLASASIWAANQKTGTIDVFSSVSGEKTTEIPARVTKKQLIAEPVALMAAQHHVWAGYSDGTVVVFDHLCVAQITTGCFHPSPIVAFSSMADGTTVSGSDDMSLVHWDTEEKNFEAITRISGVSRSFQALTCMAALDCKIVLCGSMSGSIVVVDCAAGLQVTTLHGHNECINALAVMHNLFFSASEDGSVIVWNVCPEELSSSTPIQQSYKLIKTISVQRAIRDIVPHESSQSLWVAYKDGLVERWSANPDDDFGVEQVIRDAFIAEDELRAPLPVKRREVISLHCVGTVETMRVLTLGSNGVSKVWCGYRNVVEEALEESIQAMNSIIEQDTRESALWEQKAVALKRREIQRKGKYCAALNRFCARRLLYCYYYKWKSSLASHRLRGYQREEICLNLEERYRFQLLRAYFSTWCHFYDKEQIRLRRRLMAVTLERLSNQRWLIYILSKWRIGISQERLRKQKEKMADSLMKISNNVLLATYFTRWQCYSGMQQKLPEEKLVLLAGKARQRVLYQGFEEWRLYLTRKVKKGNTSTGVEAFKQPNKSSTHLSSFAVAYAKIREERERRRLFVEWRQLYERHRQMSSLRALASAKEAQCHRELIYRMFVFWQLFCRKRSLEKLTKEVQQVERNLRLLEESNVDIFDKLHQQKRLEHLHRQHEQERKLLHEEIEKTQKLIAERDEMRQLLNCRGFKYGSIEDGTNSTTVSTFFVPSVLQKLPVGEAMSFFMSQLKGVVLNIYTDMPLFRQIRDRLRCVSNAGVIFLEGYQEVKRFVVNISKPPVKTAWRSGERWPLSVESLENIPLPPCATVVQGIKAMVVVYDMVSVSEMEGIATTCAEILVNADLFYALWFVCYAARKPTLPVNNRVSMRS